MPGVRETARNDLSKLLNGYLAHKLSKREAMQIVDSVLGKMYELGYNDASADVAEAFRRGVERGLSGD